MKELLSLYHQHQRSLQFLMLTWGAYFFILFIRIFDHRPDALYIGTEHTRSDWPLHMSMATLFATKNPQDWFAHHPMYAGGKFTYGFLTNLISGLLMRVGFSLEKAFILPSILYALLLLVGLYALFYIIFQSQRQSLLALSIFLLSSGMGGIRFLRDLSGTPNLDLFFYPPEPYSRLDQYQWYSGNAIAGLLVPQRAFLLGLMMSVWALAALLYVVLERGNHRQDRRLLLTAGVLVGLLPIAHAHSFIALILISAPLYVVASLLRERWLDLLYYAVPATLLSVTLYLIFIAGGIENPEFMRWFPGWTAGGGLWRWIAMWLKALGNMVPMAIAGFWLLHKQGWTRNQSWLIHTFFLSFFGIFLLGNLILFQPIPWDNSKLFFWAYLGFAGLAIFPLKWIWRHGGCNVGRLDVILLTFLLTFTGFLEVVRLQRFDRNWNHFTNVEDIQLGAEIRRNTDPIAIFLTEPYGNHFVMTWAARPILMGYTAWVGNFGFLYKQREKDLRMMFLGGAEAEPLLKQYSISYVVIGPGELRNYQANEAYYKATYPLAFENKNYRVYDVQSLAHGHCLGGCQKSRAFTSYFH
ncbi:MAG: hypothetical protein HC886_15065 [Leptolyngbyaceae cyanobacterium SM1_1_3]|nr:hypothetical protein [Leptolyngbyaceae cyanobacterium SM1_1_3]